MPGPAARRRARRAAGEFRCVVGRDNNGRARASERAPYRTALSAYMYAWRGAVLR